MTPERWRRLEALYHAALERPADERRPLLDRECEGDPELRREIDSLLAYQPDAERFIAAPAIEVVARGLGEEAPRAGTRVGAYELLARLGQGGMGTVYRARDTRCGREVALKLLSERFLPAAELRRFAHEARAISALAHPNVVHVHDSGCDGELHFIATELVDGATLRQRLAAGPMPLADVVAASAQIAAALAAAHAAGIVHRDVKPENVMLARDGTIKVLDFGLAKPAGPRVAGRSGSWSCTAPGTVVGTVRYMSPEQARGLRVDARSDLFSLGVVIYEMLAGRVPFDGATAADALAALLYRDPPPLPRAVPSGLRRIVARALEKQRERRPASAGELARELLFFAPR